MFSLALLRDGVEPTDVLTLRTIVTALTQEPSTDFRLHEPSRTPPAFQGKTELNTGKEGLLCLFRHSRRLDTLSLERGDMEVTGRMPSQRITLKNVDSRDELGRVWPDWESRPYDSPICDRALLMDAVTGLFKYRFSVIVSSPFRRCLETAGILARELNIDTVNVDNRLGEDMAQVRIGV